MRSITSLSAIFLTVFCIPSWACETSECPKVAAVDVIDSSFPRTLREIPEELDTQNWQIEQSKDVFSDEIHVTASAPSLTEVRCRWGTKTPSLVLECKKGEVIARFQTHCRISTSAYDDYGDVTFRVDARPTQTMRFSESEDNRSMGLWSTQDSKPFIKSLLGGEKLVAQIKPYSDEPFIAEFETKGIDAAIAPIQQACGWE